MDSRISERRIANNRIRRRRQLRHNIRMYLMTTLLAIGFSLIFFSFRAKAQSNSEAVLYKYYKSIVVQNGDTLWDYASEYGGSGEYEDSRDYIKEVMRLNSLSDHKIVAGQYLILPYYGSGTAMDADNG
ncbi:MAG: LysM peptidoglycan-binding domain-containing protein [Lachnospiraceae bacterium]|nr:LysM peptidoglycan-binding domain-containing protein [Lachnospiraceae bacterium]